MPAASLRHRQLNALQSILLGPDGPGLAAILVLIAMVGTTVLAGFAMAQGPAWLDIDWSDVSPVQVIACLLGCWAIAVSLKRPFAGLLIVVVLVYTNASEIAARYYGLPSPLQIFVLTTGVGLAWQMLSARGSGKIRFVVDPLFWPLAAYALVLFASSLIALDPAGSDARLSDLLKAILVFLLLTNVARKSDDLRTIVWALVAVGAVLGTVSTVQFVTGSFDSELGGFGRTKVAEIVGTMREPRIAGPLSDPNFYAQILAMLVPLALYRLWEESSAKLKIRAAYALGSILLAAAFTYSRGGAMAVGLVIALALFHKRVSPKLLLLGLVVLAPLSLLVPAGFEGRLSTLTEFTDDDASGGRPEDSSFRQRQHLMTVAWQIFQDHPVAGVGAGNYTDEYDRYSSRIGSTERSFDKFGEAHFPHSLPLEILSETGIVGMIAFLAIVIGTFFALWSAYRAFGLAGDQQSAGLVASLALSATAFLTTSIFLHGAYIQYFWLVVALAAAARQIALPRSATAEAGSPFRVADAPMPRWFAAKKRQEKSSGVPHGRPKVAYVMSRFPLLSETFVLREMLEMERQGVPLVVFPLLRVDAEVRHAEVEGLAAEVRHTPFVSFPIVWANLRFLARNPFRYLALVWSVLRGNWGSANLFFGALGIFPKSVYLAGIVERQRIVHIHAHYATHPALAAYIASQLTGVGYSFTAHAHDIFLHNAMLAEKVAAARFVASISEFNRKYILDRAPQTDPGKLEIVRCGVEMTKYLADHTNRGRRKGITAVCVGSLQAYKGQRYLVRACAAVAPRIPGFRCLLVGEGIDREALAAEIRTAGLEDVVELAGGKPQHEVAELLRSADIFVLPSIVAASGQMEGIPVALMEAMASGLPVVSTRISGIPELVESGSSGLLVEPEDVDALAEALIELAANPKLRVRMGQQGRAKVAEEFELHVNVRKLRKRIEQSAFAVPDLDEDIVRWVRKVLGPDAAPSFQRIPGGRDSIVFEVRYRERNGGKRIAILKLVRPNWASGSKAVTLGRPHARHEFHALSVLHDDFAHGARSFAMPRPLALNSEHAAVLIEKVPGAKLSLITRWARFRLDRRASYERWFGNCGQWLAKLHQVSAYDDDAGAVTARIEADFAREIEICRDLGLDAGLADRIEAYVEAYRSLLPAGAATLVAAHCDFAPYNVFVADDSLSVIDFEGIRAGLPYEDLAYFIGMIEIAQPLHFSAAMASRARRAFLKGYRTAAAIDEATLGLFELLAAVKIMAHSPSLRKGSRPIAELRRIQRLDFYRRSLAERVA